jgi:hypothetical protein
MRTENARVQHHPPAETSSLKTIGWAGGSLILVGILLGRMDGPEQHADYWIVSPAFFLLRLGIVMVLCAGLGFWSDRFPSEGKPLIRLFGRESLLIYVTHLLLLYGDFGEFNLTREVGRTFGYAEAGVLTVLLTGSMFGLAVCWSKIKSTSRKWTRILTIGTILLVVLGFLFGK